MTHEFHSFYYDQMQREPETDDFRLPSGTEMTPELLQRLVDEFEQDHKPRYEYLDAAYRGRYAIFDRSWRKRPDYKPNNRMAADFAYTVTQTFEGYFIGVPMTLSVRSADDMGDSRKEAVEAFIAEFAARNMQEDVDAELSKMASKFGHAYEMLYQDEEGMPRSVAVSPLTSFMVYDDSVLRRPLFFVRWFYGDDGAIKGSWSDSAQVVDFARSSEGLAFGEPSAHAFGSVPAVDFRQNTEGRGLYEGVLSLIEQYNAVLSEKANDVEYFSDCYMVVKGKELDDDEIDNIRENKIINLYGESTEGLDVAFLVKPNADAVQENLINRLETLIYKTAMVPDITDDNFATASGIALKMRMMPMSNLARNKELKFKRGVQERLRLLAAYPNAGFAGDEWKAVEVTMHRNMPDDLQSEASVAGQLSGIVSEETQLSVLSCVSDPRAEMQRKREEQDEKAEAISGGMPTNRTPTVGGQDMYKITSILRQYGKGTMTRRNALAMLKLIGVDDETAAGYLDDKDDEKGNGNEGSDL